MRQEVEEKQNETREVRASLDSLTTKLMQQEEDVRLLAAHVDSLRKSKVRGLQNYAAANSFSPPHTHHAGYCRP